jgi:murein DD-endopeptidase MepM/ murein hydrolase activator NlpD
MKRANSDKLNLVDDREINIDGTAEPSKQANFTNGRVRSAAMLGLAISVGASSILLPTGHDAAAATEPVASEATTELHPTPQQTQPNANRVEDGTASASALPVNQVVNVIKGQTLWELSQEYAVDPSILANANGIRSDSLLQVGQRLKIPSLDGKSLDAKTHNTIATLPSQTRYVDLEQNFQTNQTEQFDPSSREGTVNYRNQALKDGVVNRWNKQESQNKSIARTQQTEEAGNLSVSRQEEPRQRQQTNSHLEPGNERAIAPPTLPTVPTDKFDVLSSEPQNGLVPVPADHGAAPLVSPNVTETVVKAPTEMVVPSSSVLYNVRSGDTLEAIAKIYGVSVRDLMSANSITDPHYLKPNQDLKIPQIDANSSGESSATVIPGSNSTAETPATETATPLVPAQLAASPGSDPATPTPIVSVISALTNAQDGVSFSVPTVAKTNSIPLTQVSNVGLITQGNNVGKAQSKFTGTISSIPVLANSQEAINTSDTANSGLTSSATELGAQKTTATLPASVQFASVSGAQVIGDTQAGKPVHPPNPYADRLRAEIIRLREEYRADRNNQPEPRVASVSSLVSNPQTPTTEVLDADRQEPINPEFSPSRYAQAVQHEISTPQSQEWARQSQQQRQLERANSTGTPTLSPVEPSAQTSGQPIVARAPLGADAYDPLSNPSLGRMVSPELPPLPGADTYLPGGSMPSKGFIWPAKGMLTSGYGWRWGRMHKGIDIAGDIGTPIVAVDAGVVTYAQWNDGGYGYLVEITHDNGSQTLYAHNNKILVQEGQRVNQGQQISEMGTTGFSTGPHLHFEIHPSGQGAVNPMAFLPEDTNRASE